MELQTRSYRTHSGHYALQRSGFGIERQWLGIKCRCRCNANAIAGVRAMPSENNQYIYIYKSTPIPFSTPSLLHAQNSFNLYSSINPLVNYTTLSAGRSFLSIPTSPIQSFFQTCNSPPLSSSPSSPPHVSLSQATLLPATKQPLSSIELPMMNAR